MVDAMLRERLQRLTRVAFAIWKAAASNTPAPICVIGDGDARRLQSCYPNCAVGLRAVSANKKGLEPPTWACGTPFGEKTSNGPALLPKYTI